MYRKQKVKPHRFRWGFLTEKKREKEWIWSTRSNVCSDFGTCPIYFCGKICYNVRKGNGCNGREGFYLNGF